MRPISTSLLCVPAHSWLRLSDILWALVMGAAGTLHALFLVYSRPADTRNQPSMDLAWMTPVLVQSLK